MYRLFGIETEYGIAVEGRGAHELVAESMAVVRSYAGPHATGWNYRGEDPRRDMRGFTVDQLSTDPDDAKFDQPGAPRMGYSEERSDRILGNGARLYNDHGHPEYSTPECADLRSLVAHDKAGERIVLECARMRAAETEREASIYKNNTDFHGASYGTHECYLMRREPTPDALIAGMAPFLATRQLFAGAGKVGVEMDRARGVNYQLSQRADFFTVLASVDTLHNRPLVNTRDEPHATPRNWRRLHVIAGDANMSQWATAMKAGTTALVIGLIEQNAAPKISLRNPVTAFKSVSRDQTLKWLVEKEDRTAVCALDIQRMYLAEAKKRFCGASPDAEWTLVEWERVLNELEADITLCADRIDWVAKRLLLEQYVDEMGVKWSDTIMQSLDLAYHDVDPELSLYYGLEQAGQMRQLVSDSRIDAARGCPPDDTRAFIRGMFASRYADSVRSIGWNGIAFRHREEDLLFDMNPLVEENVSLLNEELASAISLNDVVKIMNHSSGQPESSKA